MDDNDPEVKATLIVNLAAIEFDLLSKLEAKFSSWLKLRKAVALILQLKQILLMQVRLKQYTTTKAPVNMEMLQEASNAIIKLVQNKHFKDEVQKIRQKEGSLGKERQLSTLNPFMDKHGIIRVGGRLRRSGVRDEYKHPIILPKESKVTDLIVQWYHYNTAHGGRGITLNEIRCGGFWIICVSSVLKSSAIFKCVICRKLRGRIGGRLMADSSMDRFEEAPPFTYCVVDMFGPFTVRVKRSDMKRYGAMFTCLASRAVHIEVTHSLDTDSFIQALRRLIARRGNVRQIRSDNGSNFVGAEQELLKTFSEMDHNKIENFLQDHGGDWITWKRNPPAASHMGGIWEHQIRSPRAILNSLLQTRGHSLDEESLQTLMTETEAITNSRPLTVETINDGQSTMPISPNNILTMKTKVVMPPPGVFQKPDLYCRSRWRRTQHLSNEFWSRWRKEFIQTLQERQKWVKMSRNSCIGDIALLKTNLMRRNHWPMCKIIGTNSDDKGVVRSVKLLLGNSANNNDKRILERPVTKIVLLLEVEDVDSPTKGALT